MKVSLFIAIAISIWIAHVSGFVKTPLSIRSVIHQGRLTNLLSKSTLSIGQTQLTHTALQSHPNHRRHYGKSLKARLHQLFNKRILQNAMASGFAFIVSDVIAQIITMKTTRKIDVFRIMRMCSFGFCIQGPLGTFFHRALHKSMPAIDSSVLYKKIFAEQLLWIPSYALLMITYLGILAGYSPQMIHTTINSTNMLSSIITTAWCMWVPTHVISYFVMPQQLKPFFLNVVQLILNIMHSMIVNK